MDLFDTNTTFERQLFAKAARNCIPLYGVLELLPLCNLNCDMCYVHLSKQEMQSQGKTIVVVHHALQTVSQYFDRVAMINRQLVAEGPVADIFTRENIEKTFSPLSKESESDGNT